MSPAHGRPPSKDPKEHQKRIRMSDEDVKILEYCCKVTGRTQSDIIRCVNLHKIPLFLFVKLHAQFALDLE